jgi:hypothetical protein
MTALKMMACVLAACPSGIAAAAEVLWDNAPPDGVGAFSNQAEKVMGVRRTLLDDFVVPAGEAWRLEGFRHHHIWDTLPAGSGSGLEIALRVDDGGAPGVPIRTLVVTGYEEEWSGAILWDREEAISWTTFEPVVLEQGTYWFEATVVGPENNFWVSAERRSHECWVNYEDVEGLQPGSQMFGAEYDMAWALEGVRMPSSCRADFDGDGDVGTSDLLLLLSAWGPCPGKKFCASFDLDEDGDVDTADLLILFTAWGACP